jgi:hypothetical protein
LEVCLSFLCGKSLKTEGLMKRQFVRIHPEVLASILREKKNQIEFLRIKAGIPPTAKLVKAGYESWGWTDDPHFYLTFEDDSFPELPEGTVITPLNVIVETRILPLHGGAIICDDEGTNAL